MVGQIKKIDEKENPSWVNKILELNKEEETAKKRSLEGADEKR